ncbi:unannotated protein [freshwater metagenome]|uniref:Unannotated protein n=1 Tax=freshwater metagenome TaxID=449393 RepID=A0A6J7DFQ4_9ZZZZ
MDMVTAMVQVGIRTNPDLPEGANFDALRHGGEGELSYLACKALTICLV